MRRILAALKRQLRRGTEPIPFMAGNRRYSRYQVGEWTYGDPAIHSWNEDAKLRIGKYCSIAVEVEILLGGEHNIRRVTTYPFSEVFAEARGIPGHPISKGDVTIGNDVWIGRGALILSGVTIGNGAVIGANSVVSRDVSPYSVVAGNPARHVKWRFEPHVIEQLERTAWWNWPHERVVEALPLLLSEDIEAFLSHSGRKLRDRVAPEDVDATQAQAPKEREQE